MTSALPRRRQLAEALAVVRTRIAAAAAAAGREPGEITLIAVTKFFPPSDAALLVELGVRDLGENRDQEAREKVLRVCELTLTPPLWHFVGQLQSNKVGSVAGYADLVHSVDRPALVPALARAVRRNGRGGLGVLIQVNLDVSGPVDRRPADRGGVAPADALRLADQVAMTPELALAGVMAVAPLAANPEDGFRRLAEVSAGIRADHPAARIISAGMSGDLEAAVAHGATHVRIGTALLGPRSATIS